MSFIKKTVPHKISKVRWFPRVPVFVSGTYNTTENAVSIWKFPDLSNEDTEAKVFPFVAASLLLESEITDLKPVSEELIISASLLGSISVIKYAEESLQRIFHWRGAHAFPDKAAAPVTGLSAKGHELASVGEDGKLCTYDLNTFDKMKEHESRDSCSITCVSHIRNQEIAVGNILGYLRLWDLRVSGDAACTSYVATSEPRRITCLSVHPSQSHIIASGFEDGSLCVWDMRGERKPVSVVAGHSAAISELRFHPTNPDHLFTGSQDGSLWQWDASRMRMGSRTPLTITRDHQDPPAARASPWSNCDSMGDRFRVTSVTSQPWSSVRSLDVSDSLLVWSTGNAELCVMQNINL